MKNFSKKFLIPHFLERSIRKYIVSDEKAVSFVGSGDELLQNFKQIGRYAMDNSPRILYTPVFDSWRIKIAWNALPAYLFEDEVGTNFFGYGRTIFWDQPTDAFERSSGIQRGFYDLTILESQMFVFSHTGTSFSTGIQQYDYTMFLELSSTWAVSYNKFYICYGRG